MNEALFAEPTISQPLPHSIEAEQAVIGGLMLKNDAFDSISEVLSDTDFYSKDHQLIFTAMGRLASEDQPFDPITLAESLQNSNELSSVGGAEYLVDLASSTPSSANIKAYTQIVLERSIVRQLIGAASDIVSKRLQSARVGIAQNYSLKLKLDCKRSLKIDPRRVVLKKLIR